MRSCFLIATMLIASIINSTYGFTVKKALKLADDLRIMMRYPKNEYLPNIRRFLNMYAGVLSYITLKLEQEPDNSAVEELYLFGPPRFMTMPMKEKRKVDLKANYNWSEHDLDIFLEELNDAKKVWREFARTVRTKNPDISGDPVPNKSLMIN
uniref:Uncharacterized protein n=1 Tax=Homalodisca liturata TaxID=320908 RepID=A0A1B6IFZ0_9HEMI